MAAPTNGIPQAVIAMCPYLAGMKGTGSAGDLAVPGTVDGHAGQVEAVPAQPRPVATSQPDLVALPPVDTTPPDPSMWATRETLAAVLQHAATVSTPANPLGDVLDDSLTGLTAQRFDENTVKEIRTYQERLAATAGADHLDRLIHRKQLFGGQAQVHWNPAMKDVLRFFQVDEHQSTLRISDASSSDDPDGKTMYGFALELHGRDGKPTDILMTGGTALAEHSQARSPQAQLDLFNALTGNKAEGLARIVVNEGPQAGFRMLSEARKMQTEIDTVANLSAWSRAPFSLQGQDGKTYLVKTRVVPCEQNSPLKVSGQKTGQRLANEMALRATRGETRWRLDVQFAQPHVDDVQDPRENWHGPWLTAGQVVIPQIQDRRVAEAGAKVAADTKFSVWKNRDEGEDKDVFRPFGEINRARQAAYGASGGNRGCPFLAMAKKSQAGEA